MLGHDPIRELWSNLHRTLDAFSMITVIGYSMPPYDGYAYEALGRLIIDYQAGGESNWFLQPRVPLQIITRTKAEEDVFKEYSILEAG
jgi:hypothetical protein